MKKKRKLSTDDQSLLDEAMHGVTPLKPQNTITPYKPAKKRIRNDMVDEEILPIYRLSDAQQHQTVGSDEAIHYNIVSLPPRTIKNLRAGKMAIRDRLDLHGLTIEQARQQVAHFIANNQTLGHRCVLIIHGKGSINSPSKIKTMVNHWLQQIPAVLAFCSAKNQHGGRGAIYVLIKMP